MPKCLLRTDTNIGPHCRISLLVRPQGSPHRGSLPLNQACIAHRPGIQKIKIQKSCPLSFSDICFLFFTWKFNRYHYENTFKEKITNQGIYMKKQQIFLECHFVQKQAKNLLRLFFSVPCIVRRRCILRRFKLVTFLTLPLWILPVTSLHNVPV